MTLSTDTSSTERQPILSARSLGHAYGQRVVLQGLDFDVAAGEFLSIVGPSGVGKTTLLQCLTGLQAPTKGEVHFEGRKIGRTPPEGLAIVFQDYRSSLMPWLKVVDNVALPLKSAGVGKRERTEIAAKALAEVGLAGYERSYPWQLSGGMQQRVAIARALAFRPRAIIMDEPFASVDAQTRADLEDLVLRLKETHGITILLVTHDIDEAVYLADRILVLAGKPGRIADLIEVALPSPRDQISTKAEPEFATLRARAYTLIKQGGNVPAAARP